MKSSPTKVETFFTPSQAWPALPLTLFTEHVPAGFPSPAEGHSDTQLDLNEFLIPNPPATFLTRVSGSSMIGVGIQDGDLLVVDRSIFPKHGDIVVAVLDGEHLVKRLSLIAGEVILFSENPDFPNKTIIPEQNLHIWGVVRHCIHSFKCK